MNFWTIFSGNIANMEKLSPKKCLKVHTFFEVSSIFSVLRKSLSFGLFALEFWFFALEF